MDIYLTTPRLWLRAFDPGGHDADLLWAGIPR